MDNLISLQRVPQSAAECETAIEQVFKDMLHLLEQMRYEEVDVDRVKVETESIKAEIDAVLARTQARAQIQNSAG